MTRTVSAATVRSSLCLLAALALGGCGPDAATTGGAKTIRLQGSDIVGHDISRDGRLVYGQYVAGKFALYVADADGGNARRVSFGVYDYSPFWSPDGKWILFARDQGGHSDVVIIPADSGAERVVAATSANELPTGWLGDGSGVVYTRSTTKGSETWVYRIADNSTAKLLDVDGSAEGFPSPDGKWVAYTLVKNGKSTVWLWDFEKKAHRQVTTEGYENVMPGTFSPDSRSIVFVTRRTGTVDVWRADVATGATTQLTQDVADDYAPRWSPDGTRIAFFSTRGGQPDLWVLGAGESDAQRITDDAISEAGVRWTPDGKRVVVSSLVGHSHLFALPIGAGAPTTLTAGDWDAGVGETAGGDVSRDGSLVVYVGSKNGDLDIWSVPVGGGESRLVSGAPGPDVEPSISPDGSQVAFTSVRGGNADVWIAPIGGGPARRLTDWPSTESVARWSPDGKTIAFLSNRESPGSDIWIMPVAGGQARRLTSFGSVNPPLRWSPDSRALAFSARVDGQQVFTVAVAGGAPRLVVPATSFRPAWSPDGRELSVAKCAGGYCATEVWSATGTRLRSLSTGTEIYENGTRWSSDGSQILVQAQNLQGDGGYRTDLRPSSGGTSQTLNAPAGNMTLIGFGAGGKVAIASGVPNNNQLKWVTVPAPAPKR